MGFIGRIPTMLKLFTKPEKVVEKQAEPVPDKQTEVLETIRQKFGTISERAQKSPEENIADLRGIYGVFLKSS
jgi:hypothetical protein